MGLALAAVLQYLNGSMAFSLMLMFLFFSFQIFASLEPISDSAHTLGVIDDAMDQLDALKGGSFIDKDGRDVKLERLPERGLRLRRAPGFEGCQLHHPGEELHRHRGSLRFRQDHPLQPFGPVL